jgi:peroxiredoxin
MTTTKLVMLALSVAACSRSESREPVAAPPAQTAKAQPNPTPAAQPNAAAATAKTNDAQAAVAKLIGTTPPEWQAERWLNSKPQTLASLRGSVVLVRWWTAGCPYCSASAPALRKFHQTYGPRGLKVVGMYHHKEDTPFEPAVYEETARKYGFTFPVAFDPEWRTLESWMRDAQGKEVSTGWTSVTFVLDKQGVVRHVHPGGEYVAGDAAHAELQRAIERLL